MCDYEGVFCTMNAVVFYSNTGESEHIAAYLASKLNFPLFNIEAAALQNYQNLVLVFPVHCQNIPDIVNAFLKKVTAENLTAIATYGKMCCGNVLYEIQKKHNPNIVAAAYIPTKHSYIKTDDSFCDYEKLLEIIEKIKDPSPIELPKLYKNPLADLFPKWRSRAGVRIRKNSSCDNCNLCAQHCSRHAICNGNIHSDCIRCLRCVDICPHHALIVKIRLPLKLYLKKEKENKLIIYV